MNTDAPKIGEPWPNQGGIYAGIMRGENGQPNYHLIIAPADTGYAENMEWGPRPHEAAGADNQRDGKANTQALVESDQAHPAAEWCAQLNIEGHNDYYLPARRELQLAAANAHEEFEVEWYWSSTQYSASLAWYQDFGVGYQGISSKDFQLAVRAVRRLPVE